MVGSAAGNGRVRGVWVRGVAGGFSEIQKL
jgi:hypothetical protein